MTTLRLRDSTVAIVGLGLMGTSLGLALRDACTTRIGCDLDPAVAARSHELGAVDRIAPLDELAAAADLVVLATPVTATIELIPRIAAQLRTGAVLTDLGSTKVAICDALDSAAPATASIGGHPMCGRERPGPDSATADLFTGATWVLCPTAGTDAPVDALVRQLVVATGATPIELDRAAHDRAAAPASHLPYLTAQALASAAARSDDDLHGDVARLAATGFASATRTARGDSTMWRDALTTNAVNVRTALAALRAELDTLDALLDDPPALEQRLRAGAAAVDRVTRR